MVAVLLRCGLAAAIIGNLVIALVEWPTLPERIPVHFDAGGSPDGWAARSPWVWFGLPALATGLGGGLGLLLPLAIVRMARTNSPWLNVPSKATFVALPVDARERVALAAANWLVVLAIATQGVFVWIAIGSAKVARGEWRLLPPWPSYVLIAFVVLCAVAMAIGIHRAVRREGAVASGRSSAAS